MATIFTRIIDGELPGRFLWRDDKCVSFLSINPLQPGHALVVPRSEVDHWVDLDPELATHLMAVSHQIARAAQEVFSPIKVGLMIAGLEVPHVHLHVVPIDTVRDLDFASADADPSPDSLDDAAARIRAALRTLGYEQVTD